MNTLNDLNEGDKFLPLHAFTTFTIQSFEMDGVRCVSEFGGLVLFMYNAPVIPV